MVSTARSPRVRASRVLAVLAVVLAGVAAGVLLSPLPLADVFFAAWVVGCVLCAFVGAVAAWTHRTPLLWLAALLLSALSAAGLMTVGLLLAPAALLLLGSAFALHSAGPREDVRAAIVADPPPVSEVVLKSVVGVGAVAAGTWIVYAGAVERQLFGSCATESVACVVETTHWDAVAVTVVGLTAVGFGGWLLWKQAYVARVLSAERVGFGRS